MDYGSIVNYVTPAAGPYGRACDRRRSYLVFRPKDIPVEYEPTVNYRIMRDLQWSMSLYTPPMNPFIITGIQ